MKKNQSTNIILIFLLVLFFIGLGYAYLTSTKTIRFEPTIELFTDLVTIA